MTSITDIEIYPIVSFLIFFLFFLMVLVMVFKSDRKFISEMQNLPLDDSTKTKECEYEETV